MFEQQSKPHFSQGDQLALEHRDAAYLAEAVGTGRAPWLFVNLQRTLRIDTTRSGLDGPAFARATVGDVLGAVTFVDPPTLSNLVVTETLYHASPGTYDRATVTAEVENAFAGYAAVVCASRLLSRAAHVHAGLWHCTATHSSPDAVAEILLAAAWAAGVSAVTLHTYTDVQTAAAERARQLVETMGRCCPSASLFDLIDAIAQREYAYGH
ncbi:MAG: hypothetical protein M0R22_04295 [Dehalococcoidia bacterium]|nr:hypothetical protein [Dehalococcoidia bacterium]